MTVAPQNLFSLLTRIKLVAFLYSAPTRLITPEVVEAFAKDYESAIIPWIDSDDPEDHHLLEECLQPLVGNLKFLGIGYGGKVLSQTFHRVLITWTAE